MTIQVQAEETLRHFERFSLGTETVSAHLTFGQLRILAASLAVLARFILLGQVLGASIFLVWVLRSWRLPAQSVETHGRIWRTIRLLRRLGCARD